jgi:Tol biopolymer transport system component/DNA-binding winged helix-turn-helix (wHTH) protein
LESPRKTVRFGIFEVDLASAQLRKHGIRLPLQEQPFQILAALLERRGELVTREELIRRLWPDGTFVDFDRGLNAAVARLRQALSDSAETPRYVETVARRGYRFIAPLDTEEVVGRYVTRRKGRVWIWLSAGLILAVAITTIVWWVWERPMPSGMFLTRMTADSGLTTDPAISPDGKLVAYASDRAGGRSLDIWVQQLAPGGQAIQLTKGDADEHEPSFSSDGTRIVYRSEQGGGGIYVVPTFGGEPTLLARGGRSPRFSPDGKWIAYWVGVFVASPLGAGAGSRGIYIVPSAGGSPRELLTGLAESAHPVWSPDGRYILLFGSQVLNGALPLGPTQQGADWWIAPAEGGSARPTGAFAILRQQGLATTYPAEIPRPACWIGDSVIFSARFRDTVNLWRIRLSPGDLRASRPLERLTSGTGLEAYPSVSLDRRLLFASLSLQVNLWSLPMDVSQGRVGGALRRLTEGMVLDAHPSICPDGSLVVFDSTRAASAKPELWIKDLESGRERLLAPSDSNPFHPNISRDCSKVAYTQDDGDYVVLATGGPAEKLCTDCSMIWDWSADQRRMLLSQRETPGIALFDLASRTSKIFLRSSGYLFQARFSPDEKWVVVQGSGLWISPIRSGVGARESEWISITGISEQADKPRWSPHGTMIYYTSERDGFPCIWAQRVDDLTKRPVGPPFAIYHFHTARLSMVPAGYGALEISVAKDKIVLNLGELTGNIWAGQPQ